MSNFKVIAKSAIEIVAEFGPFDSMAEAKAEAQDLADMMEQREDLNVYVLDESAQAEMGLEGPVAAHEGAELEQYGPDPYQPEYHFDEGSFPQAPLVNPINQAPYRLTLDLGEFRWIAGPYQSVAEAERARVASHHRSWGSKYPDTYTRVRRPVLGGGLHVYSYDPVVAGLDPLSTSRHRPIPNPGKGPSATGANWHRLSWGWLYDDEANGIAFKVMEKPGPGIPLYTLTALTDNGVFKHKEPYQWKQPEGAFLAAKEWFPTMVGHTVSSDLTSNWLKLNPTVGGATALDEAIATAEYVVKDATKAGQLAFDLGDMEGAGKYVRQVEKAKRDLSKLQAARNTVGHKPYLGSTQGRQRYGAEQRWRKRMGREAGEVISAQQAGGRYANPRYPDVGKPLVPTGPDLELPFFKVLVKHADWDKTKSQYLPGVNNRMQYPTEELAIEALHEWVDSKDPYQGTGKVLLFQAGKYGIHIPFSEQTIYYLGQPAAIERGQKSLFDRQKNPPEQWLQEADQEIEDDGTEGAFTKQARRAGYKNTMEFARKVMAGWRSGKKTVLNKKTRKKQGITKKTMARANFAINAQKRRRNPRKKNSFLNDDQFEAKYGVRPGDRFSDRHGEWIVDYAESYITDPPIVTIYSSDRGKGHALNMGVSQLLDPNFYTRERRRNPDIYSNPKFQRGDHIVKRAAPGTVGMHEGTHILKVAKVDPDGRYGYDGMYWLEHVGGYKTWTPALSDAYTLTKATKAQSNKWEKENTASFRGAIAQHRKHEGRTRRNPDIHDQMAVREVLSGVRGRAYVVAIAKAARLPKETVVATLNDMAIEIFPGGGGYIFATESHLTGLRN